jgi:metal-dependent amidase/aminoacylase/carboxypeptidase family protein
VLGTHVTNNAKYPDVITVAGSYGSFATTKYDVTFHGKSAHAGGAPHAGINALYACNQALSAVNALRETFKDSECVRFHPIITNGGDAVNVIPNRVCMESYVRGATMNEIVEVNRKVNRAIAASAAAIGAKVHLRDIPGYWPRKHPESFFPALRQAMEQVVDNVKINPDAWGTGCSDMGNVGAVMPALHPYISGAVGAAHGSDYVISDPETACVKSAALQLVYLSIILGNNAAEAKRIIADYEPDFSSMADYFAFMDKLNLDIDAVSYEGRNSAVLNFGAK